MKNRNLTYYIFTLLIVLLGSCSEGGEYHHVSDMIDANEKPYHGNLSSEELLAGMDLIQISEGEHTFLIPERKGQIKSYACTECHNKVVSKMKGVDGAKAHWDVKLNHANSETMNCATCHNGDDIDNLHSLTGKNVDFNLSYKLCSQCHSSQFEDWKGGAHGKKLAGWVPPRASMTCVNCHDPHDPSIGTKWPSIYNTEKVKERKDGLEH